MSTSYFNVSFQVQEHHFFAKVLSLKYDFVFTVNNTNKGKTWQTPW